MDKKIKTLKIVAFAMLSLSFVLIILGIYFYTKKNNELKKYELLTCRIVDIEEKVFGKVTLTFKDVNGNYKPFAYKVTYDPSEEDLEYNIDETYEVYYDPNNPANSEIKDVWINYETSMILIIIGFVLMLDFPFLLLTISILKRKNKGQNTIEGLRNNVISE